MRLQDLTTANRWQFSACDHGQLPASERAAACLPACKAIAAVLTCYSTAVTGQFSQCGELVVAKCLPTQNHHLAAMQPATLETMKVQHRKQTRQTVGTEPDSLLIHRRRRSRLGW